jgi:hypothetical protein
VHAEAEVERDKKPACKLVTERDVRHWAGRSESADAADEALSAQLRTDVHA